METANTMTYYIYEHITTDSHQAELHLGDCQNCNFGLANPESEGFGNGIWNWHGPFLTVESARAAAEQTGGEIHTCSRCGARLS